MTSKKDSIGIFFTGLLCIAVGAAFCAFSDGSTFVLVVGLIFLFIGGLCWYAVLGELADTIKSNKHKKEEATKIAALNQEFKAGNWDFPVEMFYVLCRDSHVTSLENEFSLRKATQLAEQIIKQSNSRVDLAYCGEYLKKERLAQYLKEGEQLVNAANERALLEQKKPQDATPNDEEKTFLVRAKELQSLSGSDKRVKMLTNLISDYDKKITAMCEGEEALKKLGMIYAQQQQKESDWAIIGGIASGIAGPAAGLAAASSVMANNQKIQQHNAAMRQTSMNIMSGIPSLAGDRYQLEEELSKVSNLLHEAKNKVVLSKPDSDEIWKNLSIGTPKVSKNESGVLAVTLPVSIKTPFVLDVPKEVSMVVDGVIRADVFFEDQLVDHVILPLPLYGIPSNMTAEVTLDGMCGRCVEFDGKYTVEISANQNLWVMEA